MFIMMKADATQNEISEVVQKALDLDLQPHLVKGEERTGIGLVGEPHPLIDKQFMQMEGVMRVVPLARPYKLTSREFHPSNTLVSLEGLSFGGDEIMIIAGPCSVESRQQILETAYAVKEAGGHGLRGGAFKPRTSPYSFQGLGVIGLEMMAEARAATGLPIVTEVMSPDTVGVVSEYADVLQIGSRNMQNYPLLHKVGESQMPVLLKRGLSSTIEELLMAAEYILSHGNRRVILCERGIRTFETATRNTTDINAIPVLKSETHLPVILDPSHWTGYREYVTAIAKAAIAAGADGLIVEVHPSPEKALSDGGQSLTPEQFSRMVRDTRRIAEAVDRKISLSCA